MIGGKLMRGVETRIQEIRHRIFREVARMAYHTEWPVDKRIEELPYKIIPGEVGNFRNDVFLERAIVSERLRLAMGLPYRGAADPAPVSTGIEEADKPETYYTPPLINVIKFACNACPEKRVYVTDGCQGCLAHPCVEVCPKDAVTLDRTNGRSKIDPDKCIRCGQCANVCAYHAIIIQERPCAAACGMDAIHSDMNGKADIDYNKCVSCGQCLVNCPFGAIADKSQIFQVIRAIQTGERVYAAVAPAFVGQFGQKVTPGKLRAAMKALGFADVFEVAIGRPAVWAGSPSSLHLVSSWFMPMVKAWQLWRASQYFFLISAINAAASSSDSTGFRFAIKRDFFTSISAVPPLYKIFTLSRAISSLLHIPSKPAVRPVYFSVISGFRAEPDRQPS